MIFLRGRRTCLAILADRGDCVRVSFGLGLTSIQSEDARFSSPYVIHH